uniref:Uncharacterized protein n=1 Tax=Arundo donax TaxID=35708 RepID=A0A0A9F8U3_ARUDO
MSSCRRSRPRKRRRRLRRLTRRLVRYCRSAMGTVIARVTTRLKLPDLIRACPYWLVLDPFMYLCQLHAKTMFVLSLICGRRRVNLEKENVRSFCCNKTSVSHCGPWTIKHLYSNK